MSPLRSPQAYAAALEALQVETDPRFQKRVLGGKSRTFCNQAVEAACEALGAHLPKGLLAREQIAWLVSPDGRAAGWIECLRADADACASRGIPVIAGWTNPEPELSSHIAMLRSAGRIWQAGARNYNDTPLVNGFGARLVRFFVCL